MSRIAFVADVHLGNHKRFGGQVTGGLNERFRQALGAFSDAVAYAEEKECDRLVVLGDLFDTARPSPQELAAVMNVLANSTLRFDLLVGNHDQNSATPGDNALEPLAYLDSVFVHDDASVLRPLVIVPFQTGPANEWLGETLERLKPPPGCVLCLHLGIGDSTTPAFLRGASDSITVDELFPLMRKWELIGAVAGNWHDPKQWELFDTTTEIAHRVYQVGTLAPTGFDNAGEDYGRVLIFDTKTKTWDLQTVVTYPRFFAGSFEDGFLEELEAGMLKLRPRYVKVTARSANIAAARAALVDLRERAVVTDFTLVPDREVVVAAANSAARAARNASTVTDAVAAYVGKMPLDDGVNRASVLERVKQYLG